VNLKQVAPFFAFAREREWIRIRRVEGRGPPWTNDPVLQRWRFCNVFREDDKTTQWFARNVRDVLDEEGLGFQLLQSTMGFRWFNRIETGERILKFLLEGWDADGVKEAVRGLKPLTTGAYMVKTPANMSKIDGINWCMKQAEEQFEDLCWGDNLQAAHEKLCKLPYIGRFYAYEIVTDLRETFLLSDADDIYTWAAPGPGATRGVSLLTGRKCNYVSDRDRNFMLDSMRELLDYSRRPYCWHEHWRQWDMRTVEHTLCEFDKYIRASKGQHLKRRYTWK
jgi:hypothetical protein